MNDDLVLLGVHRTIEEATNGAESQAGILLNGNHKDLCIFRLEAGENLVRTFEKKDFKHVYVRQAEELNSQVDSIQRQRELALAAIEELDDE